MCIPTRLLIPEPEGGWPPVPDTACCIGMDILGWAGCVCFEWVYATDEPQQPPDPEARELLAGGVQPNTREKMCGGCAYRPDSPEKTGDPRYAGDADYLEDLAATGERFWCHAGLQHPIAFRHPSGLEIPAPDGMYPAPIVDQVPYKLDGQPAELCAGWDARRRALAAKGSS